MEETHKVDSLDQPVEKYFGAARHWPWEIIYYRRLKKGPISTENYAKRLEQNKGFGTVDQYVRGWWEQLEVTLYQSDYKKICDIERVRGSFILSSISPYYVRATAAWVMCVLSIFPPYELLACEG
jgi:hypothetical protein